MKFVSSEDEKKFLNLEKEIQRLNLEKNKLVGEVNSENKKLSDLRGEQVKIEKKIVADKESARLESDKIISEAKSISDKAYKELSDATGKKTEANDELKKAQELIKQNESLDKTLTLAVDSYKKKLKNLEDISVLIKKTLEG